VLRTKFGQCVDANPARWGAAEQPRYLLGGPRGWGPTWPRCANRPAVSRIPPDLAEYADAGMTDSQIAQMYGVSARTVLRWRQAAGIPSSWQPERFPCGTRAAFRRGCRCAECLAALRPHNLAKIASMTAQAPAGDRSGTPWTIDDDAVLMGPGTLVERARQLGRSYMTCLNRIGELRRRSGADQG
jgi:hypothetical protein